MATGKTGTGKRHGIIGDTAVVVNGVNQPREFCIRGVWYRWEPSGKEGDRLRLTKDEVESTDFKLVSKYFSVKYEEVKEDA